MKMDNNASSGMMLLIEDTNLSCVSMPHRRGGMCTAPITPFQSTLYIPRGINVIVQHVPFCDHYQSHPIAIGIT